MTLLWICGSFAQYVLTSFPFPVRTVQTDNDAVFTHRYTAGPKTPLDRPVKAHDLRGQILFIQDVTNLAKNTSNYR